MNYLEILRQLTDAGGDFVIVGGVAAALHGGNRVTFDLDLVLEPRPDSWAAVVNRLWDLGARPRMPETRDALLSVENISRWINEKGLLAVTMRSPDGSVEVDLLVGEHARFPGLKRRAKSVALQGRTYFVASIDDLIDMKRKAGRPQDLLDIETLENIRGRIAPEA